MLIAGLDPPDQILHHRHPFHDALLAVSAGSQVLIPEREEIGRAAPDFPFRRDQYP
jgi:hypothetical protein